MDDTGRQRRQTQDAPRPTASTHPVSTYDIVAPSSVSLFPSLVPSFGPQEPRSARRAVVRSSLLNMWRGMKNLRRPTPTIPMRKLLETRSAQPSVVQTTYVAVKSRTVQLGHQH